MPDWTGWIEICLESTLLALAFAVVYEGARRLTSQGFSRWPALALAVGLLIPVYEGQASLKFSASVRQETRIPASLHAAEPPEGWEKAPMTPEERTALSTNAAEINFLLTGRRNAVIDADGNRVPFAPKQKDLHDREGLILQQKGNEDLAAQFQERGVRLLTNSTVFLLVGAIVGRLQRRRRATAA